MNIFERMLNTQALMFVYVMTGIIMAKTKLLNHEGRMSFINLLLDITLPCMILNSFNIDADINQLIAAGATKEEVIGVITTMNPYIGFPRTLNALRIANEVFEGK